MTGPALHGPSDLDLLLAGAWQRDFPLSVEPYGEIGAASGLTAGEVMESFRALADRGVLARIGAAVRPNTIGASTLAALSSPAHALEGIAALVSIEPGVNHNYEREHAFNLWFVVSGPDRQSVLATLQRIEARTGCRVIDLPLERAYHIDLGFDLSGARKRQASARGPAPVAQVDALDRDILSALGDGLALAQRPYRRLGAQVGCDESEAIVRISRLVETGIISRFGCILRHRRIGYRANGMAVWRVPAREVDAAGERLARCEKVTLCYRRRTAEGWPYNLFAMVHGREREVVEAAISHAAQQAGLAACPSAILFSRRCFKQAAARYDRTIGAAA